MALTLENFTLRFEKFATLSQEKFDLFLFDSVLEMGEFPERWIGQDFYDVAQAYYIAHSLTVSELQSSGDSAPMAPLRTTDVAGVKVEYAVSKDSLKATPDWLSTTSYGQQYIRYRRMAFGGPRVA